MTDSDATSKRYSLPTERDFDPYGGGLDEQTAWENFGGLTLDEACKRFCDHPDLSQEDFMFMGGKAFAFYFPVIDRYLREATTYVEYDDRQAWILAHGIMQQFTGKSLPDVVHLASPIIHLAEFVQSNIHLFGSQPADQHRMFRVWQELRDHVRTVANDTPT